MRNIKTENSFLRGALKIALPVSLQSMLMSSFSMIDQVMVGRLGMNEIAGVEVGGKLAFIFTFALSSIAGVCSIMVSQYLGKKDEDALHKSISVNLLTAFCTGLLFFIAGECFSFQIASFFTKDKNIIPLATDYIKIISFHFLFSCIASILAVPILCRGKTYIPLCISAGTAVLNTTLNYVLIFGRFGFRALGIKGAAVASVVSQSANLLLLLIAFLRVNGALHFSLKLKKEKGLQYCAMLLPALANEFLWALGQTVFTSIYGHLGTEALASMSLTNPVQGLFIGALSGLSQAAGILIGKRLGSGDYDKAYSESKKLCACGFFMSLALCAVLIILRTPYTHLFCVEENVRRTGAALLAAFAFLAPVKVLNMILGGGVLRSGGKTKFITIIDQIGTWLVGVPLAALTGIALRLPVLWVYFILSQEELLRLVISFFVFKSRRWMQTL